MLREPDDRFLSAPDHGSVGLVLTTGAPVLLPRFRREQHIDERFESPAVNVGAIRVPRPDGCADTSDLRFRKLVLSGR